MYRKSMSQSTPQFAGFTPSIIPGMNLCLRCEPPLKISTMTILLTILAVIGAILVIVLIGAATLSNDYKVERDIIINKPSQDVYSFIKYLKNQDSYNKWVMMDPNVRTTFTGVDGTPGFIYAWD